MNFKQARAIEDEARELGLPAPIYCKRCKKITSTYSRNFPAVGIEMTFECMCVSPIYEETHR